MGYDIHVRALRGVQTVSSLHMFIFNHSYILHICSNPKPYLETLRLLNLRPEECAMVAAHIYDLRAAGSLGMTTVYVPRVNEDNGAEKPGNVKTKADGGEVDYVVGSFTELAEIIARTKGVEDPRVV